MNISIVYWSGTGNTQQMAEYVAEGAKSAGASVNLVEVSEANADDIVTADVIGLGCPSMGDEVLEEYGFEPFMEELDSKISGKKVALFGSYGWGDGQWMRNWVERVEGDGAVLIGEGLIINDTPDSEGEEKCRELGKQMAQ